MHSPLVFDLLAFCSEEIPAFCARKLGIVVGQLLKNRYNSSATGRGSANRAKSMAYSILQMIGLRRGGQMEPPWKSS